MPVGPLMAQVIISMGHIILFCLYVVELDATRSILVRNLALAY